RIMEYAGRFPQREMGIMLVSDMHRAIGTDLFGIPEFAPWAEAVADVMLYDL
ncbi:MAG: ATPase, partial [Sedimenticola sp.]|nr:ATPase [Sedimenticola sp.]